MTKQKVVAYKNLPTRIPLGFTILCWLLLDRLHAPGWVYGAVGVVLVILWIGWVVDVLKQESTELFK